MIRPSLKQADNLFKQAHNLYREYVRRPIPSDIRLQEAQWLLYNSLAELDPNGNGLQFRVFVNPQGKTCLIHVSRDTGFNGLRQFVSPYTLGKAVDALGGEQAVIQMLTQGQGALMRWIVENRE